MLENPDEWKKQLELYEMEKKSQYEQAKFLFDQSRTYNTVIMGLAYGGFFSLWSAANGFSTEKRTLALAGALMTISIIAFVGFTILNLFQMSKKEPFSASTSVSPYEAPAPIGLEGQSPTMNTVIKMSIQRMVCTGCGAEANASCNCGVSYVAKSVRAAEAIRAYPAKSDRSIAAELGIGRATVQRAREVMAQDEPPEERTGPRWQILLDPTARHG